MPQQETFSNVQPVAQRSIPLDLSQPTAPSNETFSNVKPVPNVTGSFDVNDVENQIKNNPFRVLQIPFEGLGAEAGDAKNKLADKMLSDAASGRGVSKVDYVKHFLLGSASDALKMTGATLSPEGVGVGVATALAPEVMGPALAAHGLKTTVANAPGALKGQPEAVQGALGGLAEAAGGGIASSAALSGETPIQQTWSRVSPASTVEEALGRKLTPQEAATPRPGGANLPALNNTPDEVLNYAKKIGVDLTPGQATEDALAQNLQKSGTTAAVGGKDLKAALLENQSKFSKAVNEFKNRIDPPKTTAEAGQNLQGAIGTAQNVAHENASENYNQINDFLDKDANGAMISGAWDKIKGDLPMGAEEQILAQTPRNMRAVVSDLIQDRPSEGFNPTVSQTIQLRKMFRDLGDTEGLPDRTQATYSKMENAASSSLDSAAQREGVSDQWDAANQGWKDYKQKYGDPKSILYQLQRTKTPEQAITKLQNADPSDLAKVKSEITATTAGGKPAGDFLGPLRRQVVKDIQLSRYNIGSDDGLGGYSHEYLSNLFSPQDLKELYVQSDLAGRLKYDPNPSGTGGNISSLSQLKLWNQAKMSAAAKMSMPRDPTSFLPSSASTVSARPSLSSLKPGTLSLRALMAAGTQKLVEPGNGE